jgi:hypothetical protein
MALRGKGKNDTPATGARVVTPDVAAVNGDVCHIWTISDSDTSAPPTWPAGFVEHSLSPISTGSLDAQSLRWAWKIASSEPSSWTVTIGADGCIVGCAIFSGRHQTDYLHRISTRADTTSRATPWTATSNAFSSVTDADGCDIGFLQADDCAPGGNVVHTAPSGFLITVEHASGDFHNGCLSVVEDAVVGETGVYAGIGTKSGTNTNLAILAFALAPDTFTPTILRSRKLATQQRMVA